MEKVKGTGKNNIKPVMLNLAPFELLTKYLITSLRGKA